MLTGDDLLPLRYGEVVFKDNANEEFNNLVESCKKFNMRLKFLICKKHEMSQCSEFGY